MNEERDLHDEVVAYVEGTMEKAERLRFEERMKSDPGIQELIGLTRVSTEAVELAGYREIIQKVHATYAKDRPGGQRKGRLGFFSIGNRPILSGIAASVLLVLVVGAGVLFDAKWHLADRKYDLYQIPVDRSTEVSGDEWKRLFSSEKWGTLAGLTGEASTPLEMFFVAYAHYRLEHFEESARIFKEVVSLGTKISNRPFVEESEYFLALSLWKGGEYQEASEQINQIRQQSSHNYSGRFSRWDMTRLSLLGFFSKKNQQVGYKSIEDSD
ncbi:hypothetical protein [Lunatimonas salinarum]|uniref:hypothetical protein n=1 Tax=Lunatimonas salinarum TaxID=1774590 RepID=UPI001ADFE616|nr:hypothetical protein [Lunatimonas salinarum]